MQKVDYSPFATSFSLSRKSMKWPEIYYFLDFLQYNSLFLGVDNILDVGCGAGRLVEHLQNREFKFKEYLGIDLSDKLIIEAKKIFPSFEFVVQDMRNIVSGDEKFTIVFFIASLHHLETLEQRIQVLKSAASLLREGGFICMTNWALSVGNNAVKYKKHFVAGSQNQFGAGDYEIPFAGYKRYYHDISLEEMAYISTKTGLLLIENRVFDGQNNILSIFQKKTHK